MPRKVFDLPDTDREDPIEFQIGDVLYRCVDDLPVVAVYDLMASSATAGTLRFIRGCLLPEFEDVFEAQLARKGRGQIVTEAVLADVLGYLTTAYSARPTQPPASLLGGRPLTTDTSAPDSASQAS